MAPGELEQIQADYRKTFIAEMAKNDIVRCAVEWYETMTAFSDMPDDLIGTETMLRAEHAWYEAWEQLAEAVERWKEAQA